MPCKVAPTGNDIFRTFGLEPRCKPGRGVKSDFAFVANDGMGALAIQNAQVENPNGSLNPNRDAVPAVGELSATYNPVVRAELGFLKALLAFYELDSTTVIAAAGTVPAQYIHKLIPTKTPNTLTSFERIANLYCLVSGGLHGESLSINATRGDTAILRASMGFKGMWHKAYPNAATVEQLAALGLDGVTTDNYSFVGGDLSMFYGGATVCEVKGWSFSRQNTLTPNFDGCQPTKMPTGFTYGDGPAQGSAQLRFADFSWVKRFFGYDDTRVMPFGFNSVRLKEELRFSLSNQRADGTTARIQAVMPRAVVSGAPIQGQGTTPLEYAVTFEPLQADSESGRDHYLLVQSIVDAATLTATGELLTIVPRAAADLDTYSVIPGVLSGAPAGSTITIATNGFLSPIANAYAGLKVVFATGALKDQEFTIVSHPAAGGGGTVALLCSSAIPAGAIAGDEVGIIGGWQE